MGVIIIKNEDLILQRFGFYANIDDEGIYDHIDMVRSAIGKVERALVTSYNDKLWEDRLIVLGALICYHRYCLLNGEGRSINIGGVAVGSSVHDVSVSKQMMCEQYAECSDLLKDTDFLFKQVG